MISVFRLRPEATARSRAVREKEAGWFRSGPHPLPDRYSDNDRALMEFPFWLLVPVSGFGPNLNSVVALGTIDFLT